ncbi:MAG: site-specific integrase, partial [Deltaproteobacteria bacterium]|nr:site-specific integrase [Deltaproteobacteria bacterium]
MTAHAEAAIRLLLLTGLRRNEVTELRWRDLEHGSRETQLGGSQTRARVAPLSPEAARVLAGIPRVDGNPHVIPGKKPGTYLHNLNDAWDRIRKRAELEDVRLHDCRHSFASRALALGEGLTMIGKLLGHTKVETTARYAHLARESVRDSAIRVSDSIAADIFKGYPVGGRGRSPGQDGDLTP